MTKTRTFTFIDGDKTETRDAVSWKKAVKSYQSSTKSKFVTVEWLSKKGEEFSKLQKLPLGRKKKLGK
jgi:hypothetical protein